MIKDSAIDTNLPRERPRHILSVDVEDYFMVEAFAPSVTTKICGTLGPHALR